MKNMALDMIQRNIVEKLRESQTLVVSINFGTPDEILVKVSGRCPHDIALAVQTMFNEDNKARR